MLHEQMQKRCYIVAEIGQNHQGDVEIAKELIRMAKLCGADAVKSQKRDVRSLLTAEEYRRPYDSPHSFGRTYGEHREKLELSYTAWIELLTYARSLGIELFGSAWDVKSARFLHRIGTSFIKVPSAAVTNLPLLEEVRRFGRDVILSTGMSTLEEIDAAMEVLQGCEVVLMQCTSAYPVDFQDVNLRCLQSLQRRYGVPVGLSGHHRGIAVDAAGVALGARMIERHFSLDRTWKGTDHAASLEPAGLQKLCRDVRAVERALGSPEKHVLPCELPALEKLRGARMMKSA